MWFSDGDARLGSELTNDREGLERLAAETFLQEQEDGARSKRSRLLDAIHSGAEFLSQNGDEGRPLIIVVTHNREGGSRVTTSNVANTLLASSIGLEAVTIPQQKRGGMPGGGMFLNPYLFPVSRNVKTPNGDAPELEGLYSVQPILARVGGQVLHLENANVRQAPLEGRPGRIGDIDSAATIIDRELLERIRNRFVLTIRGASTPKPTLRPLIVKLTAAAREAHPEATLLHAMGYFSEGTPAAPAK
jgi:hypothetical protein